MSRKFFAYHKSLNSKPISLLKIFIIGQLIAYFMGLALPVSGTIILIIMYAVLLFIVDHHLRNNYDNIEILALQMEKLQAQLETVGDGLTSG